MLKKIFRNFIFVALLFSSIVSKYSFADEDDDIFDEIDKVDIDNVNLDKKIDPFENSNRKIFDFNLKLYNSLFIPINKWYENNFPMSIRWTMKNYIQNYTEVPNDIIYSVFDFDIEGFIVSFWRFTINTLFGMFGGDDVASLLNLRPYNKSLDKILYFYHVPRGPFLILPFLGASTVRATSASAVNLLFTNYFFMNFLIGNTSLIFGWQYIVPFCPKGQQNILKWEWFGFNLISYLRYIDSISSDIKFAKESSLDVYKSFRDKYLTMMDSEEKKYIQMRMEGTTTRTNVCDYDAMIELPDECDEDPKEYGIGVEKFGEISFD